jgi:peptide/nickel transport system permease protein
MRRYLLKRLLQSIGTLVVLSIVIFGVSRATGDPLTLILPMEASDRDRANLRQELGLDRPLVVQYGKFVEHAVQGDFGTSLYQRVPVNQLIAERLPNSAKLAFFAMFVAVICAIPMGVAAAVRKGSTVDRAVRVVCTLGQSLPAFCVAIVLVDVFAGRLNWFPAGGMGDLRNYVLPGLTLGWFAIAGMARLVRSSMIEILDSDYIKLARLKGLSERRVIFVHALKNALIPVITFSAVYLTILVTAAIVVETVFAWPGMGRLAYQAIISRDFPVIQAVVLVTALIVALVNLGTDCLYAWIDPRIRIAR